MPRRATSQRSTAPPARRQRAAPGTARSSSRSPRSASSSGISVQARSIRSPSRSPPPAHALPTAGRRAGDRFADLLGRSWRWCRLKYVVLVLRADNDGEGGILAFAGASGTASGSRNGRGIPVFVLLGIAAAALLYGDGVITPAISVLSAIEGLKLVAPWL